MGFLHKLHIIYLINDVLHNAIRKTTLNVKSQLQEVIVPIYCHTFVGESQENQQRCGKVVRIWETNSYFDSNVFEVWFSNVTCVAACFCCSISCSLVKWKYRKIPKIFLEGVRVVCALIGHVLLQYFVSTAHLFPPGATIDDEGVTHITWKMTGSARKFLTKYPRRRFFYILQEMFVILYTGMHIIYIVHKSVLQVEIILCRD